MRRFSALLVAALAAVASAQQATAAAEGQETQPPAAGAPVSPPESAGPIEVDPSSIRLSGPALRTTAGTFGDPLRALLLLPGVSHVVSGAAPAVVRGLQPATTGVFLDGVPVPMPFHLIAGPGVLQPDFVGALVFTPGHTQVEHGRLLGGTVELEVPEATGGLRATATLDLLMLGAFAQQRLDSGTAVTLAGRFSHTALIGAAVANALRDDELSAALYDYQAHVAQPLGAGELRLLAFGARDGGGQRVPDGDTLGLGTSFHRVDLRGRYQAGRGELEAGLTYGFDQVAIAAGGGAVLSFDVYEQLLGARASMRVSPFRDLDVKLGGDFEHHRAGLVQGSSFQIGDEPVQTRLHRPIGAALYGGGYLRAEYHHGGWRVEPALRLSSFGVPGLSRQVTLDPRLWLAYQVDADTALSLSGGVYHQVPTTMVRIPALDVVRTRLTVQELAKVEAAAERRLPLGVDLRTAVYVYPMARMVELSPLDPDFQHQATWDPALLQERLEGRATSGMGYGLELMAALAPRDGLSGWASYSFQQSTRRMTFPELDEFGQELTTTRTADVAAPLEQAHVFNLAAAYTLPSGWRFSAALHFNTGMPEAGGLASFTQREGVEPNDPARESWVPVERDQVGRLPAYWRLDARVSKAWRLGWGNLEAYLDVLNVAFSRETVRYNYNERAPTQQDRLEGNITLERSELSVPVLVPLLGVRAEL